MEVGMMTLEQLILDELKQMNLNGVTVLSVVWEFGLMRVVFELSAVKITFTVNNDYQFQVVSVNHNGKVYDDPQYLVKFEDLAFDVMTKVKLAEMKKRLDYKKLQPAHEKQLSPVRSVLEQARLEAVIIREEKIRAQEAQLDLREQEIKKLEQSLYEKENAISLQRREEEMELEAKRIENREKFEKTVKRNVDDLFRKFKKPRGKN